MSDERTIPIDAMTIDELTKSAATCRSCEGRCDGNACPPAVALDTLSRRAKEADPLRAEIERLQRRYESDEPVPGYTHSAFIDDVNGLMLGSYDLGEAMEAESRVNAYAVALLAELERKGAVIAAARIIDRFPRTGRKHLRAALTAYDAVKEND